MISLIRNNKYWFCIILFNFYSCIDTRKNDSALTYYLPHHTGIQTGGIQVIPIQTPKGIFNVWTKRIGNNPVKKVLLLNGGPGTTHEVFECMENFLPQEHIEFIYYDQLACGNSENPKDTSLYDLNRYVEEVEQVRKALKLDSNNFFLLGHSWGGILAMQYALKYQEHIKGLIVSNMMASCPKYDKYANEVLAVQLDPTILDSIRKLEAAKDFSNPRYSDLLITNYYSKHVCRKPFEEVPEPLLRAGKHNNNELYFIMQGPSEFGISGKLENWDISSQLKNIKIPTLVIGGTFDTMDPVWNG
jgi:proline iminopeptidase